MKDAALTSGFTRLDFLLAFSIDDADRRARFTEVCASEWGGTRITETTWELATPLSPAELEIAIAPHLAPGEHAAYYYLTSPSADSKRLFRVVVRG